MSIGIFSAHGGKLNGRTLFAPTLGCADIGSIIRQQSRDVGFLQSRNCGAPLHFDIFKYKVVKPTGEQCSPLHCVRKFYCRKIASLFADFALYWRIVKRCRVGLRYLLCTRRKFVFLLFLSAPLVGLRRMRLCPFLVSEVEQEIYSAWGFALRPPQWVSPLDPDQGRAPGPFARFARWVFYFALASFFVRRCHSSLLT